MILTIAADTHGQHDKLGRLSGEVFIFAGDATMYGEPSEYDNFFEWLSSIDFEHKIIIPGNHDFHMAGKELPEGVTMLINRGITIDGIRFYGMPYTPNLPSWAFQSDEYAIEGMLSEEADVLITHGPPHGILDVVWSGDSVGSYGILKGLGHVTPDVHVFGHIHEAAGVTYRKGTLFANVSVLDEGYNFARGAMVLEYEK